MAVNCGVSYGVCRLRVTTVDASGNVIGTSNNSYVTDNVTSISLSPDITTGDTLTQLNGCGCKVASFKVNDTFNFFTFAFQDSALEPALMALMLGTPTIEDGSDIVGQAFAGALACDEDEPAVALEFWTKHIVGSGQDGTYPWIHWVFPKSIWQLGDNTFDNTIAQPTLNGFSRTNTNWGDGPYGDGPPDGQDISEGGWWKTDVEPPTAACAYANVTPSS